MQHKATIKSTTWEKARKKVASLNPSLAKAIDNVSPGNEYLLFEASYPYGSKIVNKGLLHLPGDDGKVLPIDSPYVSSEIKNQLIRRTVPVSLILKNCAEVSFEMEERLVSLNLFSPGFSFGLWENLDPTTSYYVRRLWNLTAGARSIYMLPKITEHASHKTLRKKYGVRSYLPQNLLDHWRIFSEIANSPAFETDWNCKVLFFSDNWMNHIVKDSAWKDVYNMFLQDGWIQSQYWRNKVTFDIIWEVFTNNINKHNIKPNPHFLNIVKHMILVGTGLLPGSIAADYHDNSVAPIAELQKVYIEDYKLRQYIPTFLIPHHFSATEKAPIYYSFQQPAMLETAAISYQSPSTIRMMPEIKFLMEKFHEEVLEGEIKADNTPIATFADSVVFDYFHSEANIDYDIKATSEMPKEDKRLISIIPGYKNKKFAGNGHFIRGCARLSSKKS
ncbi:MAG: hypothetical protein ACE365_05385 [Gammaproteobacteria bacterium]